MLYFYDADGSYIGCRLEIDGELPPQNATKNPVELSDWQEAHFIGGAWVVKTIAPTPATEPDSDQKTQAIIDISKATTISGLRAAMLKFIDAS